MPGQVAQAPTAAEDARFAEILAKKAPATTAAGYPPKATAQAAEDARFGALMAAGPAAAQPSALAPSEMDKRFAHLLVGHRGEAPRADRIKSARHVRTPSRQRRPRVASPGRMPAVLAKYCSEGFCNAARHGE